VKGYPKLIKEEYPDIPFKTVDSVFSISTSIFFFKDYEFWQNDWSSNVTGKMPFKSNAAVSWRNPRLDNSLIEPLAYVVSNSSMYKFNYWSIPMSQESLDIRYFLFDCVQANYKPHNSLFLGPSYKQAFIADDVYNKETFKMARDLPLQDHFVARLINNNSNNNESSLINDNMNKTAPLVASLVGSLVQQEESSVMMRSLSSKTNNAVKLYYSSFIMNTLLLCLFLLKL
jgi:hypothetical protein